jgi:adenylate cyclase
MIYAFEDCQLDLGAHELTRAGRPVPLERQVFALLELLVENSERLVSRDEIVDRVWGGRIVSEAALSSRIKSARAAIGDDGRAQRLIQTHHGLGYRFVGGLRVVTPASAAPGSASDIFISYARSTEAQARRVTEALQGLGYSVWRDDQLPAHRSYAEVIQERLTAAKAVVVIWSADAARSEWVQSEADRARAGRKLVQANVDGSTLPMPFDRIQCADLTGWTGDAKAPGWRKLLASIADLTGAGPGAIAHATPTPARPLSICVLPFANMSDDPQQEYFSDGISEDIITDLSKVSTLSVTARNTAFTFKGKDLKVPELARELGVSHVLAGSVRKAAGRVRITAQLIDGAAGDHLWAERYDRDLTDIFALQDEIAEAIVGALKLTLLPAEKAAIKRHGTANVEAYNLYLMARRYWLSGNQGDPGDYETIVRLCERATQIDPAYAQAWILLAAGQTTLTSSFGQVAGDGAAAIEQALALDPDLAEAHALKARLFSVAGRHDEAAVEIDIALRLDPGSFEVNLRAGTISYHRLRLEDAVRHLERAVGLDETSFSAPLMLFSCYAALGDDDNARRVARVTLARAETATAKDQNNSHAMACAVNALAVLGEADRAKEWMDRALLIDPDNKLMRYNFTCALSAHLGDSAAALDMLGALLAQDPAFCLGDAKVDPDLDALRNEPRFHAMIAAAEARLAAASP